MPLWEPLLVLGIAALVTWGLDAWLLRWFQQQRIGSHIRKEGPASHLSKAKTPALGGAAFPLGFLIAWGVGIASALARGVPRPAGAELALLALLVLLVTLSFFLGFADDYLKVIRQNSEGLKARYRLPVQLVLGAILGAGLIRWAGPDYAQWVPIPGLELALMPSLLMVLVTLLFFAGTINAVNFTDGLDTLLAGTGTIALVVLGTLSYGWFVRWVPVDPLLGHAALAGAGTLLGFYPHNRHPAKLFMGDGGAYFIGALLATLAALQGSVFLFLIIGGVFFLELLSVILQVSVFRLSGGKRRLFPMAPLHHSFEVKGWPEEKVVALFWGMGLLCAILGLLLGRAL